MYEKLSEEYKRNQRIELLKETGLKEIAEQKERIRQKLFAFECKSLNDEAAYDLLIATYYTLNQLKKFFDNENSFKKIEMSCKSEDVVVYTISTRTIDIWLSLGVVNRFLVYYRDNYFDVNCVGKSDFTDEDFGYRSNFLGFVG